jgi:hypothetical protein
MMGDFLTKVHFRISIYKGAIAIHFDIFQLANSLTLCTDHVVAIKKNDEHI